MKLFFLVLARDNTYVYEKIKELENLKVQYKIVCGERLDHPNIVYQDPRGKYAAINFGVNLVPQDVDIVVMNDVDTRIHNIDLALKGFNNPDVGLVFGTELVKYGPQNLFFRFLNPIRRKIPIAGTGELMLVRRSILVNEICPLQSCKAEDTYILFKVLQGHHKIAFCEECYAETERTKTPEKEEIYKRRTVAGIYQALSYTNPPFLVRFFYYSLPFVCPFLLMLGTKGYYWTKGIFLGFMDYVRGDRSGVWQTTY
jgi:cellulose synthase/poly-beta-1,6-N-acetylglucosamine synthase-like glycosyltransferase